MKAHKTIHLTRAKEIQLVRNYGKKITKSQKEAREFLVDVGIFTPKGNLRKPYKNLQIPKE